MTQVANAHQDHPLSLLQYREWLRDYLPKDNQVYFVGMGWRVRNTEKGLEIL